MAKLTKDELIEAFKEMTLIELSEFVKEFEEVFDVEAAAPVAAVAAGAPAEGGAGAAEEKTEFDVVLTDACLLYTSPSPRDRQKSRMPSSA